MVSPVDAETPRTRRRGALLEESLHRAALEELAAAGYAGLTMEGVARRARTGKAALYRRWPSKRDLVLDALEHAIPDLREAASSGSVRERLLAVLTLMSDSMTGRAGHPGFAVMGELLREPELRAAFNAKVIEPRLGVILDILRGAAARGDVDPASANRLLARTGPALVIHSFLLTGEPPPRAELLRIVDTILIPLLER